LESMMPKRSKLPICSHGNGKRNLETLWVRLGVLGEDRSIACSIALTFTAI